MFPAASSDQTARAIDGRSSEAAGNIISRSLTASQIDLSISGKKLLNQVSLTIEPGYVTLLIGPNGAGKSTLLKVLSGDLKPDRGQVAIDHRLLFTLSPLELALRRAVVAQQTVVNFHLLVKEVIEFGSDAAARARNYSSGERKRNIQTAAEYCRCEYLLTRHYHTLSGGEQARVHLARALAQLDIDRISAPVYLLLDEPVASLDPEQQHLTMQLIRTIATRGVGVLTTLHDLNLARQYGNRIAMMKQGKICYQGTAEDVLQETAVSAVFHIGLAEQSLHGYSTLATLPSEF